MAAATDEHDHGGALPMYIFNQQDVTVSGLEAEIAWQLHNNIKWTLWGDTVSAKLDNGGYLPRTAPTRLANQVNINYDWQFEVAAVKHFKQTKTAPETETAGYTLVDAGSYNTWAKHSQLYLAANNLTDQEARVHTSLLKDQAPLPGRNLKLGFSANF